VKSNNPILDKKEETLSSELIYKGKSFSFYSDLIKLPDGRTAKRDYVKYPEAVVIIPFLDEKNIIFEKQYRYPVLNFLYELPAGKIDDIEETKIEAAQRELLEETGYRAKNLEYLISYYPAVGYSSEIIHVFKASDLTKEEQLLDEDEFIETITFSLEESLEMIKKKEIKDAKTILSLLYYITFCQK